MIGAHELAAPGALPHLRVRLRARSQVFYDPRQRCETVSCEMTINMDNNCQNIASVLAAPGVLPHLRMPGTSQSMTAISSPDDRHHSGARQLAAPGALPHLRMRLRARSHVFDDP